MDTSGLSTPLESMPQDIHRTLWVRIAAMISAGHFAVTAEIYGELTYLTGEIGDVIRANEANLVLEVGDDGWDFLSYIGHVKHMELIHKDFIREHNGGRKGTIGLNDLSIIALGKTLRLPVVSMETRSAHQTTRKRKIPDVCDLEGVSHMTFTDMLRAEGITL